MNSEEGDSFFLEQKKTKRGRGRPPGSTKTKSVSFSDEVLTNSENESQQQDPFISNFQKNVEELGKQGFFIPKEEPTESSSSTRKKQKEPTQDEKTKKIKEQQRIKYVKKVNRYLDNPVIKKYLPKYPKLPINSDFDTAFAAYQEIKSHLNRMNLQPFVEQAFIKGNKLLEMFFPSLEGLSICIEQNIHEFEPEIPEIAEELADYMGESNVWVRLGVKWLKIVQAYQRINYANSEKLEQPVDEFFEEIKQENL